jgi:hypothetical protein
MAGAPAQSSTSDLVRIGCSQSGEFSSPDIASLKRVVTTDHAVKSNPFMAL